jgi:hypothetical protein
MNERMNDAVAWFCFFSFAAYCWNDSNQSSGRVHQALMYMHKLAFPLKMKRYRRLLARHLEVNWGCFEVAFSATNTAKCIDHYCQVSKFGGSGNRGEKVLLQTGGLLDLPTLS